MRSDPATTALRDILRHIDLANDFVAGFDRAAFDGDVRTIYAVTRCLEIVSEASRRLPDELKARHPAIAWKQMAGAGNVYRHDYEDVAARYVWDTVQLALPPLRMVIERELASGADPRSSSSFPDACNGASAQWRAIRDPAQRSREAPNFLCQTSMCRFAA
jgi:uncharacterized protein with HEPN domain